MLPRVPMSMLDLVPVGEGADATEAVQASLELARRADELGFTRYWLAEHHNMAGIASSAPAVMIAAIAAATRDIRVGSGGVMLPNHAPLVVAEQFGTLAALHPGRIDLGLGRAPGTDQYTAAALRRAANPSADDFPEQLGELGSFLAGEWPDGHPYGRISAVPHASSPPVIWLLGSSLYSAELAGLLGMPFAFAHHFSAANTLPALARYRESFRPGRVLGRAVRDGDRVGHLRTERRGGGPDRPSRSTVLPAPATGSTRPAAESRDRRGPSVDAARARIRRAAARRPSNRQS